MPVEIRDKYQYFTQADITNLRKCGYQNRFTPLKEAMKDYVRYLSTNGHI